MVVISNLGPLSAVSHNLQTVPRSAVKTVFDEAAVRRRKDAVELIAVERLHPGTSRYIDAITTPMDNYMRASDD
jgi:hypothetical protein